MLKDVDHDKAHEQFSAYWDEELTPEEALAFDAHLKSCASCTADFKAFEETLGSVKQLHQMAAPGEFVNSVRSQINRRSRGRFFGPRKPGRFPLEIITLVTLALVLAVYIVVRFTNPALNLP